MDTGKKLNKEDGMGNECNEAVKRLTHEQSDKKRRNVSPQKLPKGNPVMKTDKVTDKLKDNTGDKYGMYTPKKPYKHVEELPSQRPKSSSSSKKAKTPRKLQLLESDTMGGNSKGDDGKDFGMNTPEKRVTDSSSKKLKSTSASKTKTPKKPEQSISSDEWISDDDDNDLLDTSLERKASKLEMTAKNVKSLIHYVLSDKHVKQMFEDVLAAEKEEIPSKEESPAKDTFPINATPKKSDTQSTIDDTRIDILPKLTRAKMKDLMEKVNIPLSPAKQQKPAPSILDVDFGEEEDDEEYSPDKDESNETDDESIVSSQFSEFGSPYPRTPGTPVPLRIVDQSPLRAHSPSVWNTQLSELNTSRDELNHTEKEDEGTIAFRTRSKLPLTETSLVDIEEAFVAPDITPDMYDTNYDDVEWRNFLSSLYKSNDDSIVDDEVNDPEFNYIAEAENEQIDAEDFRFDKPAKISRKELSTLIEELHGLFDDDEVLPYQVVAGVTDTLYNPESCSTLHNLSSGASYSGNFSTPQSSTYSMPTQQMMPSSSNGNLPATFSSNVSFSTQQIPNNSLNCNLNTDSFQSPVPVPHSSLILPQHSHTYSQSSPAHCESGPNYCQNFQSCANSLRSSTPQTQFKTPQLPPWQQSEGSSSHLEQSCHETDSSTVSAHHRALIQDNIRKHVQLLAQTFLMTHNRGMDDIAEKAKNILTDVDNRRQSSSSGMYSVLNVCNLDPAMAAINAYSTSCYSDAENSDYEESKFIMLESPAFMYTHLLPSFTFNKNKVKKNRDVYRNNKFLPSENNLIALGLEQFTGCRDIYTEELLAKLLIRGKTANQIFHNIRFLSKSSSPVNPVKKFRKLNHAVELDPPTLDPVDFRAPKEKNYETLPNWCKVIDKSTKRRKKSVSETAEPSFVQHSSTPNVPEGTEIKFIPLVQLQNYMNISVIKGPANETVLCNDQFPQTELPHLSSLSLSGAHNHQTQWCIPFLQTKTRPKKQEKKLLSSSCRTHEKVNIKQCNSVSNSAVEMSSSSQSVDNSEPCPSSGDQSPHLSPPDMSMRQNTSPESESKLSFYDSPSALTKVPLPASASTPNVSKQEKPSTVRNLGPEFDRHDNVAPLRSEGQDADTDLASETLLSVEQNSYLDVENESIQIQDDALLQQNESTQNVSVHGASLIDPDLILPHSPPKKPSQAFRSTVSSAKASSSEIITVNKVPELPKPVKPSVSNDASDDKLCSIKDDAEIEMTVSNSGQNKVVTERKRLQLKVIENPLLNAKNKRTKYVLSEGMKSVKGGKSSSHNKQCESQKEKKDETGETDPVNLSSENTRAHEKGFNTQETSISEVVSSFNEFTESIKPDTSVIDVVKDISRVHETTTNVSTGTTITKVDTKTNSNVSPSVATPKEKTSGATHSHESNRVMSSGNPITQTKAKTDAPISSISPKEKTSAVPQSPTIVLIAGEPLNEELSKSPVIISTRLLSTSPIKIATAFTTRTEETGMKSPTRLQPLVPKETPSTQPTYLQVLNSPKANSDAPLSETPPKEKTTLETSCPQKMNKVVIASSNPITQTKVKADAPISPTPPQEETSTVPQSPTIVLITGEPFNEELSKSPVGISAQMISTSPIKTAPAFTSQPDETGMKTPTKLRPIAPKESSSTQSPAYVPLPKISPKRKELNRQVRHILPKSFIFEAKNPSPTKATAMVLKKRAICQQRSPVKILPRLAPAPPASWQTTVKSLTRVSRMFTRSQQRKAVSEEVAEKVVIDVEPQKDAEESETSEVEDSGLSQEEGEENDEDQMRLDDLMAASTTISFAAKQSNAEDDTKGKSKKQKELALLQPDLVESDPKKDERDIAFAQHYFDQVKEALQNDPGRFRKFLDLLKDMNKNHRSPVELYADIVSLLSDHQQLVEDFAGFLLSFQALECHCFTTNHQITQIRRFLRQIEVHCGSSASTFQKALRALDSWVDMYKEGSTSTSVREKVSGILKNIPGVLDDLICYFLDGPLADCQSDDFEDVNMPDDLDKVDEFEDVTLPDGRETYNTKTCSCQCHSNTQDEKLLRRIKHCIACSLKMDEGLPVLNISRTEYRPISIVYPLEEKEKLIKAKKEAAQAALAKARAQRQKKGKKKKPIKKLKPKKKGGKLKRKRRRSKAVSVKKTGGDMPQQPDKKVIGSSSRGGSTKIRISSGTAKLVGTCTEKELPFRDVDETGDKSSSSHNDQTVKTTDTVDLSEKVNSKQSLPGSHNERLDKSSTARVPLTTMTMTRSQRKRQAPSPFSPEEFGPPSKKRALPSAGIEMVAVTTEKLPLMSHSDRQSSVDGPDEAPAAMKNSNGEDEPCVDFSQEGENEGNEAQAKISTPLRYEMLEGSQSNEDFDRCILSNMSFDGISEEGIQAVCDRVPGKSAQEVRDRARTLVELLENMSEATTDMEDD